MKKLYRSNSAQAARRIYNKNKTSKSKNTFYNKSSNSSSNFQRLQHNKSNSVEKASASPTDQVILQYLSAEDSNLLEWCERTGIDLLSKYGKAAEFFFNRRVL